MLESLSLINFQRHASLTVELEQINCFLGRTGAGKSAVLRALRWLTFNKPSGDAFRKKGSKAVEAILRLEGHEITRRKGSGENVYVLDQEAYRALGTSGVPDSVAHVLNLSPLSFQGQHDPPFLLSLSPGQAAAELNSIVDLSLIDTVLSRLASEVRRATSREDTLREQVAGAKGKVASLRWVKDAARDLERVEYTELQHSRIKEDGSRIVCLLEKGIGYQEGIRLRENRIAEGEKGIRIGEGLRDLQERVLLLGKLIVEGEKWGKLASQPLPSPGDLEGMGEKERAVREKREWRVKLGGLLGRLEAKGEDLCEISNDLEKVEGELARVEVCPECRRPL